MYKKYGHLTSYIVSNDVWMQEDATNVPAIPPTTPVTGPSVSDLQQLYDILNSRMALMNQMIQNSAATTKAMQDMIAAGLPAQSGKVGPVLLGLLTQFISTTPVYPRPPTADEQSLWINSFGNGTPLYGACLTYTGAYVLLGWNFLQQTWEGFSTLITSRFGGRLYDLSGDIYFDLSKPDISLPT